METKGEDKMVGTCAEERQWRCWTELSRKRKEKRPEKMYGCSEEDKEMVGVTVEEAGVSCDT